MTDADARERTAALADRLGLLTVPVGDRPGLVSAALQFRYLNQAVALLDQHTASREAIDAAMRFGCGLPLGPFETLDLIGTDTACDILDRLAVRLGDREFEPSRRLRHMVMAGLLGRKSGRGFYDYRDGTTDALAADAVPAGALPAGGRPAAPAPTPAPASGAVPFRRVGIVGSGTMATGIAEVFAVAGHACVLVARSEERAAAALDRVGASLDRAVRRGRLAPGDRRAAGERLDAVGDFGVLAGCDVVIEAVAEDLTVKTDLFRRLGRICAPGTLLSTTTSSLPVLECALASGRPEDVVGLHFFNPAPMMRLVEVVPSLETAPERTAQAHALCHSIGKHPVQCADRPGFIVNALLFPYLNAAVRMVESDRASADDIDTVMKAGFGYPLGPLELLDVIGLDVSLSIQRILHDAARRPGSEPAELLGHLVTAGRSGRKSGAGFRVYG